MTTSVATAATNPLGLPGRLSRLAERHASGYAVIDLETTGTDPEADRIVSLALIGLDEVGSLSDTLHVFVDPERPIPPEATRIHGITVDCGSRVFKPHGAHVLHGLRPRDPQSP